MNKPLNRGLFHSLLFHHSVAINPTNIATAEPNEIIAIAAPIALITIQAPIDNTVNTVPNNRYHIHVRNCTGINQTEILQY